MKSFLMPCILFLATTVCAQNSKISPETNKDDNSLLWEISGNGLTMPSYLFGTFHLLCKDDINFSSSLKQAVKNSSEIYLELDMDDPSTLFGGMMLMSMKGGKKLKDFYKPEDYKRLTDYFKDSLKMPIGMLQSMKPEFLVALLYPKMMPCNATVSVEEEIMALAKQDKKEIKGLETMAFQASVFDSIPYEKQAADLLESIDSMEKSSKAFNIMLTAYKNQQLKEIEKLVNDPEMGMEDNQDLLLNDRNKNWVGQLKIIMKKKPVFVAVGAGHLVGEQGVISLLKKEGYTLRPLTNR